MKWNSRYQESTTGNHFKTIQPSVFRSVDVQNMSRKYQTILYRLQSGHCNLRAHLHRIEKSDSSNCLNCGTEETVSHFMRHCTIYETERSTIEHVTRQLNGPFDLATLLGDPRIMPHAVEYVLTTSRNV